MNFPRYLACYPELVLLPNIYWIIPISRQFPAIPIRAMPIPCELPNWIFRNVIYFFSSMSHSTFSPSHGHSRTHVLVRLCATYRGGDETAYWSRESYPSSSPSPNFSQAWVVHSFFPRPHQESFPSVRNSSRSGIENLTPLVKDHDYAEWATSEYPAVYMHILHSASQFNEQTSPGKPFFNISTYP